MKFSNPVAIIFDMDGVLFLSSPAHAKAYRQMLAQFGIRKFDYGQVAGMNTNDSIIKINSLYSMGWSKGKISRLKAQKSRLAYKLIKKTARLAPGCRSVIKKLSKKYKVALVSSGSRRNVNFFLKKSGLKSIFEFSISGDEVRVAKPNPLIYKTALRKLKCRPRNAVVVEDSKAGVLSAKRAHIPVMGITGTLNRSQLRKTGAKIVIDRLNQFLRYV